MNMKNNNNKKKKLVFEEREELLQDSLEEIRRQAMKDLASAETAKEILQAGYTILASYGFEGDYLKSSWRRMHAQFH
jgi:hypothetical protein